MNDIRHNEPYTIEDVTLILDGFANGKFLQEIAKAARRTTSGVDNLRAKYRVFKSGVGVIYISPSLKDIFKQYDASKAQRKMQTNGNAEQRQPELPEITRVQQDVQNSIRAYVNLVTAERVKAATDKLEAELKELRAFKAKFKALAAE